MARPPKLAPLGFQARRSFRDTSCASSKKSAERIRARMPDAVSLQITSGVARITLSRPARRNALDEAMWSALAERVAAAASAKPRALIVTGDGGHFAAGMDLGPDNPLHARIGPAIANRDVAAAASVIAWLKAVVSGLAEFPAPTFAAIEGACAGSGFEIALHCDVRVAAKNCFISLPEVRIGMVPDVGGTTRLTRLVGPGRAARLIATGERITGEEAFALGMVEKLVEPGQALAVAEEMARLVAKGGPTAVREALSVIRRVPDLSLADAYAAETAAGAAALTSGEPLEGVQAFFEKRDPRWPENG
jgi:enoyl-CoA hydratase/carnithine racemase